NEVYETVLAWYIMRPVTLALINPKAGAFNVTAKGGVIDQAFFDWTMARPYLVILLLNFVGICFGIVEFVGGDIDARTTIAVNLVWALYNITIACASVAVASESRQLRTTPRVSASLPATVLLNNGKSIVCRTTDFSQQGLGITLPPGVTVPTDQDLHVSVFRGEEEGVFPATVVYSKGQTLGLRLDKLDLQQQSKLAQITFGRADTWAENWGRASVDTPMGALREVSLIGMRGMKLLSRSLYGATRTKISTSLANRSSVSKR
ncbi:MAG: UDP-forming cellulose synthase catalytic subunit, partial [Comamonadaceae bacterium]